MFGPMPAWGFYLRHARNVAMSDIDMRCLTPDARPAVVTDDVQGLRAHSVYASAAPGAPMTPFTL
jgi:hypothetical protein